jgi:hypothetical protein
MIKKLNGCHQITLERSPENSEVLLRSGRCIAWIIWACLAICRRFENAAQLQAHIEIANDAGERLGAE